MGLYMEPSRNEEFLTEVKNFVDTEVRPYVGNYQRDGVLPVDLIRKIAGRGLLGCSLPQAYGGLGVDPLNYGLATEIIGRACSTVRTLLTVHTSLVGETIVKWGTSEQKSRYLPIIARGEKICAFALSEPDAGSDTNAIRTRFKKTSDGYLLSGKKKWISFGAAADLFLTFASDGTNICAFLVDKTADGVSVRTMDEISIGAASHMAEIQFNEVHVSADRQIGANDGMGRFLLASALDQGRYSIAWAGMALASESLEKMVGFAKGRTQFGQSISDFQLIKGIIADSVAAVQATRAVCERVASLRAAGAQSAPIETTIAKYLASKSAVLVTSNSLQVHGAVGFTDDCTAERLAREARVLEVIEGTSQIQQIMISDYVLSASLPI